MDHTVLIAIVIVLGVATYAGVLWWIVCDAQKRGERKRKQEDEIIAEIERVEFHVRKKDGTLESRSLTGQDAKDWHARWVFKHVDIDYAKFAWKKVPVVETKEIKWP